MTSTPQLNFDWDPHKARQNLQKHKVSFEQAATVFLDPLALSIFDEEHSDEEERWTTLGRSDEGLFLVVIHTFREAGTDELAIRLISARQATRRERKQYEADR